MLMLSCRSLVLRSFCVASAASTQVRLTSTKGPTLPYLIRRAKKEDIYSINQCNRDNLPENYSHFFYNNHLEKWPELSLIAETRREGKESPETIGYALGRIQVDDSNNLLPSFIGHIASVAINKKFRGLGVAQELMKQLHRSFSDSYNVDEVSLNRGFISTLTRSLTLAKRWLEKYIVGLGSTTVTPSPLPLHPSPARNPFAKRFHHSHAFPTSLNLHHLLQFVRGRVYCKAEPILAVLFFMGYDEMKG
jgi:ribosomal protein S18 acetylase RimI-like enzyme